MILRAQGLRSQANCDIGTPKSQSISRDATKGTIDEAAAEQARWR